MNPIVRAIWNRWLGRQGEDAAAKYLRKQGMRILRRNERNSCGEIDLIARDGDTLVFVEVKTRRDGIPAEAVTPAKERCLTRTAMHFLHRHHAVDVRSRFDIVAITWPKSQREPKIEHIRNAFEAVDTGPTFH